MGHKTKRDVGKTHKSRRRGGGGGGGRNERIQKSEVKEELSLIAWKERKKKESKRIKIVKAEERRE